MLQFIFGKPSSGKTYTVLNKIKSIAELSKQSVLIVPEQFTFESERAVLKTLGDSGALNTTVLSFSRLCDEVSRNVGFFAGDTLSDADKVIFMNRALVACKGNLKLWQRYTDSVTFAKTMLDTIGEFKINYITAEDIKNAAEFTKSSVLKSKLNDIAVIFENYDALVGEKFIDPADNLSKLYHTLENFSFFKNKTVFIDSFKGFTGQQYKIIERIMAQADDVYISLTNDCENIKEYGVFSNIRKAAQRIEKIARAHAIEILPPIILGQPRFKNEGLLALENFISDNKAVKSENPAITVCHAATAYDEVQFAARTIRNLVRTKGYRFRDFVIIARDADTYAEAVSSACKKNKVSLFYDNRVPLSAFPLAVAAENAIEALDFSTENILRFHKTGLGTLNTNEISELENYTYLWNIDRDMWKENWNMDPRGFITEESDQKNDLQLERINELRKKAIRPIIKLQSGFADNAYKMAKSLTELFDNCNVSEKLCNMSEKFKSYNESLSADVLRQSYSEYMKILDSLVRCFADISITKSEFYDALTMAVTLASVGVIPQMLDEVTFGSADRIRPSRPKIAFILGANQGVFPKSVSNAGIFNLSERKELIESGIEIADNSVSSAIDEEYLVYCNLCCANEEVYISYCRQSAVGEAKEPAVFLQSVIKNLTYMEVYEPDDSAFRPLPETLDAALSEYCRNLQEDSDFAATIYSAAKQSDNGLKFDEINSKIIESNIEISPDTAQKLFGKNIFMSATRFDTFNRCRFSFFCRYGLKAQKLQPAQFDVMQRGTIVHYVLERLITEKADEISMLSENDLEMLTDMYIEDYLNSVKGYKSVENETLKFAVSRLSRSLKEVVKHIAAEITQSDFKPVACELKIGKDGEVPPAEFDFEGGKISVSGSIDRVDEYNGYVRIIDYKTGSKAFKLPDVLFGLNLQMLIYLYALLKGRGLEFSSAAGILYQPSKRDLSGNGMAMNGLLKADENLVMAMDKGGQGEFVPKLQFNKDGSLSKRNNSFVSADGFVEIFAYIEKLMEKTGKQIHKGDFAVSPMDGRESNACKYCEFSSVCGIENSVAPRVPELDNSQVIEIMKEGNVCGI